MMISDQATDYASREDEEIGTLVEFSIASAGAHRRETRLYAARVLLEGGCAKCSPA